MREHARETEGPKRLARVLLLSPQPPARVVYFGPCVASGLREHARETEGPKERAQETAYSLPVQRPEGARECVLSPSVKRPKDSAG